MPEILMVIEMVLFDETKAWDTVLEAGLFPEFSNSFFIAATKRE